jgi:hypothetical protein
MARKPASLIAQKIVEWRRRNGLSRRAAVEVFKSQGGYAIPASTLKHWERGDREPGSVVASALQAFLEAHAVVRDPPVYRSGPKPREKKSPPQ